jgi:hypothetical protein
VESFSGCRVLSYCLMSNHFHLLVEVPPPIKEEVGAKVATATVARPADASIAAGDTAANEGGKKESENEFSGPSGSEALPYGDGILSEEEFFTRLGAIYSEAVIGEIREEIARAREGGNEVEVARIFERYTSRMHDLSEFMKSLLQRFTR